MLEFGSADERSMWEASELAAHTAAHCPRASCRHLLGAAVGSLVIAAQHPPCAAAVAMAVYRFGRHTKLHSVAR